MALITGSTTIDWSGVVVDPIDLQQDFDEFSSRFDQVATEVENGQFSYSSPPTSTFRSLTLFSGGKLTIRGSGFGTPDTVLKSFNYSNPFSGDVVRFTGTLDLAGNGVFNSLTLGFQDVQLSIIGNIVLDPLGNTSGSITQLQETLGSTKVTIKGDLVVDADFNISGTVAQISVLSGTNTILMSGLSLPYAALDSVTTANDLFSAVGNQMSGDDIITYTNNSNVGMTFSGGPGNDTITISGPNADTLNGGDGNDILVGGLGQDTVNGGAGDDRITMLVTANNVDTIDAGDDTDTLVLSGVVAGDHVVVVDLSSSTDQVVSIGGVADALPQINFENLNASGIGSSVNVTGSAGANNIIGSKGNDSLEGGAGNDTLNGGLGADSMAGGLDDDTYTVDNLGDTVTEQAGEGTDTIQINRTVDLTLFNDAFHSEIENVVLTGVAAINAKGDGGNNLLTGNSGANTLSSFGGTDQLIGNAGNDTFDGCADDDVIDGGVGNDVILIAKATDHGVGEVIDGGAGTDVIRFTSTTPDETLVLNANVTGVESVVIGTPAGVTTGLTALNVDASNVATALTITGNGGANVLTGTSANDTLNGGAGNDTLDGGLGTNLLRGGTGNDSYIVNALTDVVSEGLAAGTDTVVASLNYTLGANLENLELTGSALNGTGNTLANVLTGNDGNNVLNGGGGNDTLLGGLGQDTVNGGTGNDRIVMQVTAGDVDVADGGAGLDTLALVGAVDGDGVVVVDLSSLTDQVTRIGTVDPESLVQINFENLDAAGLGSSVTVTGSVGANIIIGSSGADNINGGAGNDVILIGAAADHGVGEVIDGGTGTDVIRFTSTTPDETLVLNAGVTGVESVVIGTATGLTTGTTALNVDASALSSGLSIAGNAADNVLTGTSANDILNGGAGNDTLNGGSGNNTLIGGTGNDSYIVNALTDVVSEGLAAGTDTVVASLNYTLGANVENLTLTGSAALNGTGNTLANILTGNDGSNVLDGGGGNDTLLGGLGQDTVTGGTGNDRLVMRVTAGDGDVADGGAGLDTLALVGAIDGDGVVVVDLSSLTDQVTRIGTVDPESLVQKNFENLDASGLGSAVHATGNASANIMIGSHGNDILTGNAGNDTLNGGAGDDTLDGGEGNDTFLFGTGAGQDLIQDSSGSADKMLFSGGINPLDLVISRQANDLRLAIHGSSDQITVQNWYTSSVNRAETIQAGNGEILLSAQVDQLIQAMAGFTQQTGLTWDQAIDQQPQDVQTILAANWQ